jgi:hypothetical protein
MTNWAPAWGSRAIVCRGLATTRMATTANSAWRLSRTTDIWPTVGALRARASTGGDAAQRHDRRSPAPATAEKSSDPVHNTSGPIGCRMAIVKVACR